MTTSWDWISDQLQQIRQQQLWRQLACRHSPQQAVIELDGQSLINFSSNDYLGLANDPRLAAAASDAIRQFGWGSGASPLITGRCAVHAELERALAAFKQVEAALLFPSGYAANVGAICSLVGDGDTVLSDAKNHASIIDGCRLSGARGVVYPHGDVEAARGQLRAARGGRKLIVTDSLFSMDGDLAPLKLLSEVAREEQAMLLVDEAHAAGVLGARGSGGCELAGIEDGPLLQVGTLSKAFGSAGGFVAGSRQVIQWLVHRARPQFFSTASPAATAAASLAALRIVEQEPQRRRQLLTRSCRLREQLREQGWHVPAGVSQIIPVVVGKAEAALQVAEMLRGDGLLAPPIRPPSVPAGESLLRISLTAAHHEQHLEQLVAALARARAAAS